MIEPSYTTTHDLIRGRFLNALLRESGQTAAADLVERMVHDLDRWHTEAERARAEAETEKR